MVNNLLPTRLLAVAAAAIVLFSCNQPAKTTVTFNAAATKAAIEQKNQAFADALKKGDSVAVANFYTDDAQLLGGGPDVLGKKQITAEMGGFIRAGIINAKLTTLGVWGTDSLGYRTGTGRVCRQKQPGDEPGRVYGGLEKIGWRLETLQGYVRC
jgi:ketosteroid isomerase-like protein